MLPYQNVLCHFVKVLDIRNFHIVFIHVPLILRLYSVLDKNYSEIFVIFFIVDHSFALLLAYLFTL